METSYLLFELDNEIYAINIDYIVEVMELNKTMQVPEDLEVSIIDLRTIFDIEVSKSKNKEVIVINKNSEQVGLIIDRTLEIGSYDKKLIKQTNAVSKNLRKFIKNVICDEGKRIMILDIESIINQLQKLKIIS